MDTLVEAYLRLRQRGGVGILKLRAGGSCGPADTPFVNSLRARLSASGLLGEVEFCPNLDRAGNKLLVVEHLQHRQRRLAGHRIADVSPAQAAGGGGIHNFRAARHRPEWETRGN